MSDTSPALAPHFESLEQQHETNVLGMWIFLATEVLFFGGLFTAFLVYTSLYPEAVAEGSSHLYAGLGAINTSILLSSSLTMALAIHAVQIDSRRAFVSFLLLTALLGMAFLGLKSVEYYLEYEEQLIPGLNFAFEGLDTRRVELFFVMYFVTTGLHAVHLTIGIVIVLIVAFRAWRGHFSSESHSGIELTGLYWHFVDLVWVFVYPLFYLLNRHT